MDFYFTIHVEGVSVSKSGLAAIRLSVRADDDGMAKKGKMRLFLCNGFWVQVFAMPD